ncbi:MAG: 30S ribosome-binding factor RbfA [Lentimicrobiaceae bacterium]|nr:30S ribosome-binding factor RbfA [Lentimicrobiaceae bacterium]
MESKRQQKIARLLQKELGEIMRLYAIEHLPGFLITVTRVNVSPDLSIAKVYMSLFGAANRKDVFDRIQHSNKEIRHQLALRIGKQIRVIPELSFYVDDSLDYIENIDNLLRS